MIFLSNLKALFVVYDNNEEDSVHSIVYRLRFT